MTSKPPTTSSIDILSLLQDYESLHQEATVELKSSIWNITKARRERGFQNGGGGFGGLEFSADDVREQLRAHAVLECPDDNLESALIDENEPKGDELILSDRNCDYILSFDGQKKAKQLARERADLRTTEDDVGSKENTGLRRRTTQSKPEDDSEVPRNKWISENACTEDEEPRNVDELCLFGVPPPSLRVAQAHSRKALAKYVQVANLASKILKMQTKFN